MSRAVVLAGRLLRAAAGIAATVALLAGVPWGLAQFTGSPLPRTWPGWQQAQRFAASPLSDGAIIRFLADAAWLLWAIVALSLIIELAAVTRGQPAPRLPAIAPVQALAATLIGATMMTALHLPRPGLRTAPPLHAALTAATTISAPLVPVQTAQQAAAPGTAHPAAPSDSSAAQSRPKVYRVKEGDDLWDIAARFLDDPEDWHELYRLNEGKPQPDGRALIDPSLILPGWVLLIPQPANGHAPTPHPGRPGTPAPGGGHTPQPSPQPSPPKGPSPQDSPPAGPATPASPAAPGTRPPADRGAHPPQFAVQLPSGALIGIAVAFMVAAALTLAAVQRRRRYRPRHGPPSSLKPEVPPLPEVITTLRRAARPPIPADPDDGGPAAGDPYFDVYEGRPESGGDGDGAAAPGPRPGGMPEPGPERPARRELPPGTVPAGLRGDGTEATVDITALGGLGLTGPGAEPAARALLAALLAQAQPSVTGLPAVIIPAADATRLLPAASPATIPGLSVPGTLEAALGELETLQLTLARISGAEDDLTGGSPGPAAAGPGVTLIATPGQGQGRRLAGILDAGRRTGIAAILLGPWAAGVTCQVAADGTVTAATPRAPDLDRVRLFTLGAAEASAIAGVLQEAGGSPPAPQPGPSGRAPGDGQRPQDADSAAGTGYLTAPQAPPLPAHRPAPAPASPASAAAAEPAPSMPPERGERPVQLTLLGPLQITANGQEVAGGMRKARELLAFLAVHPDGASADTISEALWPGSDTPHATTQRNLAVKKARRILRTTTGLTAPMWISYMSGRYHLDPNLISTDLGQFSAALDEAQAATDDEARLAACQKAAGLYHGELVEGEGYDWAEPYAETARRRALDAWTTIAEILQVRDPGQALSALESALSHDPYNEYLYQRIMRLQAAAGRPETVRRTLRLLETRLTDLGITPGAQTRQVAASLLGADGSQTGRVGSKDR